MSEKKNFKIAIIGAGFSAAITKLISKNSFIFGNLDHKIIFRNQKFFRRKNIECNKFFSKKIFSFGSLKFDLVKGVFHDHLRSGGNSNIWGGHINIKNLSNKILLFLKKKGIKFRDLNYDTTGTTTNNFHIKQMQNNKGKIFTTEDLDLKVDNKYLNHFYSKEGRIILGFLSLTKNKIYEIKAKKIFLCLGTIQLLDLLFRSNFIKDGDLVQFSEFEHKFKWKFTFSKFEKNCTSIRYHISRTFGHYFGQQYFSNFFKLIKFLPFCVDQNFYKKKKIIKLILKNDTLKEYDYCKNSYSKFGDSIHYCDLKINGMRIDDFLKKINNNIFGVGMPFINQINPGPISNDIILDIVKKLDKSKVTTFNDNK